MNVSGNQSQVDANSQAEAAKELQDVSIEELDTDFGTEDVDDPESSDETSKTEKKSKFSKKGDITKKKRSKNPTSLALLNGEISDKELLNEQSDKAAKSRAKKDRDAIFKRIQKEFRESAQEDLKSGTSHRLKDIITISTAALRDEKIQKEKALRSQKSDEKRASIAEELRNISELDNGKESKLQKTQKQQQIQSTRQHTEQTQKISEALQTYVSAYSESMLEEKPQKKEEVRQLRESLQKKGLSTKKMNIVERNIQQYIRKDLKKKLKQNFIETTMFYATDRNSRSTISKFYNYKELLALGESLGVLDEGIGTEKTMKDDVKFETRSFIAHELDASLSETRLRTNSIPELIKNFDRFNKLAGFSGFNAADYMKHLRLKLEDQGLTPFINPNAAQQSYMDTESGKRQGRQGHQSEESDEEVEGIEESLRRLYIRKHTSSLTPVKAIKMKLETMKIEKKLRVMGKGNVIDTLQKEGHRIATFKLNVRLRETFEERATLPRLEGPKYHINKKKLKETLKGLKKLGSPVLKSDMIEIRDQANRSIFTLIKEEYIKLEVHAQSCPNDRNIAMKVKEYKQLLERLKTESKITESLKPRLMQDLSFLSDLNIVEAA